MRSSHWFPPNKLLLNEVCYELSIVAAIYERMTPSDCTEVWMRQQEACKAAVEAGEQLGYEYALLKNKVVLMCAR